MRIIKVYVDKLPDNCCDCMFCNGYYTMECSLNGEAIDEEKCNEERNENCPLNVSNNTTDC